MVNEKFNIFMISIIEARKPLTLRNLMSEKSLNGPYTTQLKNKFATMKLFICLLVIDWT